MQKLPILKKLGEAKVEGSEPEYVVEEKVQYTQQQWMEWSSATYSAHCFETSRIFNYEASRGIRWGDCIIWVLSAMVSSQKIVE